MEFFNSAIEVLQTLVVALGAGLGVWGAINLLEGYGNDNPGSKTCRFPHLQTAKARYCSYMPLSSSPHRHEPCPSMGFARYHWKMCSHTDNGLASPVPFGV